MSGPASEKAFRRGGETLLAGLAPVIRFCGGEVCEQLVHCDGAASGLQGGQGEFDGFVQSEVKFSFCQPFQSALSVAHLRVG